MVEGIRQFLNELFGSYKPENHYMRGTRTRNKIIKKENKMKVLGFLTAVFGFVFLANLAYADDLTLDMLNKRDDGAKMVYSQDVARVNVGDTITWVPTSKGHNVEMVAGPEGAELPKKSKMNKEFSMTFETPGIYYYWCTPHKSMGMIGLVIVGDDVSNKDAIAKAKAMGKSKKKLKALLGDL